MRETSTRPSSPRAIAFIFGLGALSGGVAGFFVGRFESARAPESTPSLVKDGRPDLDLASSATDRGLRSLGTKGDSSEGPAAGIDFLRGLFSSKGPFGGRRGDENPFAGWSPERLAKEFETAASAGDFHAMKMAAEALGALSPEQVQDFSRMFLECGDPKIADMIARELVRNGGKEGLEAVLGFAKNDELGLEFRGRALEALNELPPERREEALPLCADLLRSSLPEKLQHHAAGVYGRMLGPEAVAGLSEILLEGNVRPEPILFAMSDLARPEDMPRLAELLGKVGARSSDGPDPQEILLRAMGNASGRDASSLLMGFLEDPPEGVRRDAIGRALGDFVAKEDLPRLWEALEGEGDAKTQAELARSILRVGGGEEVERLVELARNPALGLSPEAFSRVLGDTADAASAPLLVDVLRESRAWEAAEPLARGIARGSGHEGLEELVEVLGEGGSGDRRAAIASVLEREGNAALIPSLVNALGKEDYGRVQWHLARAIAGYGPEGVEALKGLVNSDADPGRRSEVLRGLDSIRPDVAASLARDLLRDPSPDVRRGALKILAGSKAVEVGDDLRRALAAEADPDLRGAIEEALKER